MNKVDKEMFIRSLCDSVRDTAIDRIKYMPPEWDGIEVREYLAWLAWLFAEETILSRKPKPDRKRLRGFHNTVATRFGL